MKLLILYFWSSISKHKTSKTPANELDCKTFSFVFYVLRALHSYFHLIYLEYVSQDLT